MEHTSNDQERIAILGAGISGLSLGWLLSRLGKRVTLFEATDRIGGLARTFDWHGIPCDIAPHRLYSTNQDVIDRIATLTPLREHRRNSRILMKDRVIQDPINPFELLLTFPPAVGARLVWGFLARPGLLRPGLAEESFESLALSRYGRGLYDFFFEPYTRKLFGVSPAELSVTWGREKLRSSGLIDSLKRRSKTFFSTFYYPEHGGYGAISEAMRQQIHGEIQFGAQVTGLQTTDQRVTAVTYRQDGVERTFDCDRVFSTLPATRLGQMFGQDFPLRFRAIQLVYLNVNKPQVMPYQWVYFGDGDVAINRMAEFANFQAPQPDRTNSVLCAEVTTDTTHPLDDVLNALERYRLLSREDVTDTLVLPERYGYPVYDLGFESVKAEAQAFFGQFGNLHNVGRNAEFRHIEADEDLESALDMVRQIYPGAA